MQVSENEAAAIKDLDAGFGYHYIDTRNGQPLIEFHIDYQNCIVESDMEAPYKEAKLSI